MAEYDDGDKSARSSGEDSVEMRGEINKKKEEKRRKLPSREATMAVGSLKFEANYRRTENGETMKNKRLIDQNGSLLIRDLS